jgi:hypothetical protein
MPGLVRRFAEITVLTSANLLAGVARFAAMRSWIFARSASMDHGHVTTRPLVAQSINPD